MTRPVSIYGVTVLVSDAGEVWTTSRTVTTERCGRPFTSTYGGRKLKPRVDRDGYLRVRFSIGSRRAVCAVHRLVATAFVDNPDDLPCVNHKNERKDDNRSCNLEWCTVGYNNHYNGRYDRVRRRVKRVVMLSADGEVLETFGSVKCAAAYVHGNPSNIGNACYGRLATAYGYKWRFGDEH